MRERSPWCIGSAAAGDAIKTAECGFSAGQFIQRKAQFMVCASSVDGRAWSGIDSRSRLDLFFESGVRTTVCSCLSRTITMDNARPRLSRIRRGPFAQLRDDHGIGANDDIASAQPGSRGGTIRVDAADEQTGAALRTKELSELRADEFKSRASIGKSRG